MICLLNFSSLSRPEGGAVPFIETAFFRYLVEFVEFLLTEKKAAVVFGTFREASFRLTGQEAVFVTFP